MGIDRKDIDDKYKWKIDLMYSSQESIDKDISKIKSYINEIKEYKGKLSQSKENMYEALNIYEKASQLLQNLYVYTHMKQHEDTRINENQAMATKTDMLSTELSTASSYMVPEIIAIDESKLKEYLEDEKLSFYKKYIEEILREKPHTLSEKEEEILAAVSDLTSVPENAYDMLSYADMDFPKIENEDGEMVKLTHSNFSTFLKSKNNKVRKNAFDAMYKTYDKYKNTFASMLYGGIKSEIFYSKTRKYESALYASLFQDDISFDVYNNLIKAVDENLDTLNRYVDIKKKFLGLEDIHMYDLYVPLTENFDMKIPYEEAQEIVLNALKPLGEEYLGLIKRAFEENWIDVYENEGKQGGAYSWGSYDSHPYILMGSLAVGCGSSDSSNSNKITISGSTSVGPVVEILGEDFEAKNEGVSIEVQQIGSSAGIKNAIDGTSQIGMASRDLKDEEKAAGLKETQIAIDGIAVITNKNNTVKDLTLEQVKDIYTGKITNWKEVGGNDAPIVVVSREDGSGTRDGFQENVGFESEELTKDAQISDGSGNIKSIVEGNENAIGYISFGYVDENVNALTIDGVELNAENVKNDSYAIARPFLFANKEDVITEQGKNFIDFILSEEGQNVVEENGFISVN